MKIQNIARLGGNMTGCDCEDILQRLTALEEVEPCDCEAIDTELKRLDQATAISGVRVRTSPTPQMAGLGASVISIGPTFNYWGSGVKVGNSGNLVQQNYYLVTPAEFPELAWYQGSTTISTVWISTESNPMPLYINQTGIWFHPTNTMTIPNNATFNFTQTLILTPPTTP
ncbi:MAG: hypothetical protein FWE38_02140 [Firmicutes bacterium]|nr:hypothetical protein [Bacillota bacterium]